MLGLGCDNPDPSFRWIMIEFWHFDKSDSFLAPGIWRCCEEPERVWRHCWDKTSRYSDSSNTTTTTGSSSPHQRQSHGPFYPHLTKSQVRKKYKKVFVSLARLTCFPLFLQFAASATAAWSCAERQWPEICNNNCQAQVTISKKSKRLLNTYDLNHHQSLTCSVRQ